MEARRGKARQRIRSRAKAKVEASKRMQSGFRYDSQVKSGQRERERGREARAADVWVC